MAFPPLLARFGATKVRRSCVLKKGFCVLPCTALWVLLLMELNPLVLLLDEDEV